ncbi:MAG: SDR family oxidoreductase [Deltaproteobacteria bacterium]|nr:SDR family oxidoreductase [Deltaproteobacteria bacterium]
MDLGLKGRVAFVAGGSKGLGRATAHALAREGASVAICARGEVELHRAAEEIARDTGARVIPLVGDVGKPEDIERLIAKTVEHLGALHVVVSNSGGPPPGTFEELSEDAWREAIDVTLMSTVRLVRAALPHLRHAAFGRVVVITSTSTREAIPGLLLSNVVRPALVGLCKTLARELAQYGITVNNVGPGMYDTERLAKLHGRQAQATSMELAEVRRRAEATIPVGRLGAPEELARVIAFLASEGASYVTGQTILADGGKTAAY